jgi:hypothetical protein
MHTAECQQRQARGLGGCWCHIVVAQATARAQPGKLGDWPGRRVRLAYPGHPDDGQVGQVVIVKRADATHHQRAWVRWDNGDASYAPVANLVAV